MWERGIQTHGNEKHLWYILMISRELSFEDWSFLLLKTCVKWKINHFRRKENTLDFLCMPAQSLKSCLTLCDAMDCSLPGSSVHGILQGKNTGVGCHALLQRIFLTQGSNLHLLCLLHLPHHRQILYCWTTRESPVTDIPMQILVKFSSSMVSFDFYQWLLVTHVGWNKRVSFKLH